MTKKEARMQSFDYHIGHWKAHTSIIPVDGCKLMAMIKVSGDDDQDLVCSRHTVVFEHEQGSDVIEETKRLMTALLKQRYRG